MNQCIYLDYNSTTPLDPKILEVMLPYFKEEFGNCGSNHRFGFRAKQAVEKARNQVADLIHASTGEIIFTSGATESNNMAIWGVLKHFDPKNSHVISCKTEHKAVVDPLKQWEKQGGSVTYLKPDLQGRIKLEDLKSAIRLNTRLVSLMHGNNEIGTVHPVKEIGKICREKSVLFHCDAAQSFGKMPIDVNEMNIDLLSFSGHKIYGPKGIGGLYVRSEPRVLLDPIIYGGGQEKGLRSGTHNVPAIVGMGEASRLSQLLMDEEEPRIKNLRNKLRDGIVSSLESVVVNGDPENYLPGTLHLSLGFCEQEALFMGLADIACSSGSACSSTIKISHVLEAVGMDPELAQSSLRFGLGRFTTEDEIEYAVQKIIKKVNKLRSLSPTFQMKNSGVNLTRIEW